MRHTLLSFSNPPSSHQNGQWIRTDLNAGNLGSVNRDFYMKNGSSAYVYVEKVRFGRDGSQAYYNCDR